MRSSSAIHYFSQKETVSKKADKSVLGIRGRQANEFAELGLPVLPGFIIDSTLAPSLSKDKVYTLIKPSLARCQDLVGKVFGDTENPLLLKIVISPNLAVANYPTLHNFGLAKSTLTGFEKWVGLISRLMRYVFSCAEFFPLKNRLQTWKKMPQHRRALALLLQKFLKCLQTVMSVLRV